MQKSKSGFTLIELLVVIVVIVILAAIGVIAYSRFQMQSRDDKRRADVEVIVSKLEQYYDEHNEYPPSCTSAQYDRTSNVCPPTQSSYAPRSGPPINAQTTDAELKSILKNFPDNIKDPLGTSSGIPLILDTGLTFGERVGNGEVFAKSYGYTYHGGYSLLPNNGSGTYSSAIGIHGVTCWYTYNLPPTTNNDVFGSAFVAYYSEADDKVYFKLASRGIQPTLRTTTSGGNMPDKCEIAR